LGKKVGDSFLRRGEPTLSTKFAAAHEVKMKAYWNRLLELMRPPTVVARYDILEFMARDQQVLDHGRLMPIPPDALAKGEAALVEHYRELLAEATRLVDREVKLVEQSRQLHATVIQFGLIASGIVASLGAWLDLRFVWLPLVAFIFSIASAWWFLCQDSADWLESAKMWGEGMPNEVNGIKIPERFRKEMHLHLYERSYHNVIRDYRRWLHSRLAVPASLFVLGLVFLLVSVTVSR
jgi:hypothetical protein